MLGAPTHLEPNFHFSRYTTLHLSPAVLVRQRAQHCSWNMLELNIETRSSQASLSSDIPLLPGERIDSDINGREVIYMCPYSGEIPGQLYVTNYKIYFKSSDASKSRVVHVPFCVISKIDKFGGASTAKSKGDNSYGINITCKDIRTLKFAHNPENHSRRDVFEKLKQFAFPLSHPNKQLFCFEAKV